MEKEKLIEQLKQEQIMIKRTLNEDYDKTLPSIASLFGDADKKGNVEEVIGLLECENNILTNKIRIKLCRILEDIKHYSVASVKCMELMENHIKVLEKICTESLGIATDENKR